MTTSPYAFPRNTRAVLVSYISSLANPATSELNGGTDISADLVLDGLNIVRVTESVDGTKWTDDLRVDRSGHYSFSSPSLTGIRSRQSTTETLWSAAVYRTESFLVVRRGVPRTTAWTMGDVVEVLHFRFGKRSTVASSAGAVLFTVPLFVIEDVDAAVVGT